MGRRVPVALCVAAAVAAVVLAACRSGPRTVCENAAGATVCMEISGSQVRVRGTGFASGSTVKVAFPGETGTGPIDQTADADGRVPGKDGAVVTALIDKPRPMTWEGTSVSGKQVHVELVLPPA